jgi:phosphoglycerate kinase
MTKKTVRDIDLTGKTVLLRVDYNVPIEDGKVGDPLRIEASFDTICYLLARGCKLVMMSHLGRPDGKPDPDFSLKPVAAKAAKLLGQPIEFVPDCVGPGVEAKVAALKPGQMLLLENLRFHPEEEANEPGFAKALAGLGQVYVNDAFAVIHRAHASTVGVTKHLPAVAGLLVEREVNTITEALEQPRRPLVAIVGGAKVSDKIEVLDNLLAKVDVMVIGGAMANTFLAAEGIEVGKSRYEPDQMGIARKIKARAEDDGIDLVLPTDLVVTGKVEPSAKGTVVGIHDIGPDRLAVDVGPKTIEAAAARIKVAGTVIWNGPMGVSEVKAFAKGSLDLARIIAQVPAESLIGGGDTAAFIDQARLHDQFSFISTGGGAGLELMAGKKLPGIEALLER